MGSHLRVGLMVAAALALGAFAPSAGAELASQKAVVATSGRRFEVRRGVNPWGFGGLGVRYGRRAAYGWTNAHQKRVAQKKRNQARHRAASKGR